MNMIELLVQNLIDSARREDWKTVDEQIIPELVKLNNIYSYSWALTEGLSHFNEHVRDAAASLLGKQLIPENVVPYARDKLYDVMINDKNPFVRYRAAMAIAKIGADKYLADVRIVLGEALTVDDVKEPAQEALDLLGK